MKKTILRDHPGEIVESLSLTELCRFCGTETQWVVELVEHEVLRPTGSEPGKWLFEAAGILRARKASRLHHDLGINAAGVAMVLDLLDEREQLRRELSRYDVLWD